MNINISIFNTVKETNIEMRKNTNNDFTIMDTKIKFNFNKIENRIEPGNKRAIT